MLTLNTELQYKNSRYESLYSMRIKKFLSAKCPVWSGICLSCVVSVWCATSRRQHQIPQAMVRVGDDWITPAAFVRNLGIYLDADASMRSHVIKTVSICFAALRQIRSVRNSIPRQAMLSLVVSLVLTRLDYGRRHSPVFQHTSLIDCSPWWTPPHG